MTTQQTIMIIIALIGCFVGFSGYLSRRDGRNINDAIWKGEVNGKLDAILGVSERVKSVECDVKVHAERLAKVESKADSAHHRLDDHINKETI